LDVIYGNEGGMKEDIIREEFKVDKFVENIS
jgi:hypothetical protein